MALGKKFSAANLVMAALFFTAVIVQFNDPDPWRWIAMYLAAGLVCLGHGRLPASLVVIGAAAVCGVGIVWGGYLVSQVLGVIEPSDLFLRMDEKGGAVEVGREAGGLVIVGVWMAVLGIAALRSRRAHP